MLVLEGKGAPADAEAFRAAGIGDFDVFDFAREGKRPDGATVKVAFSLAFADDKQAPDTGFFTCQQHFPENFWNPAFQQHANGVTRCRRRGARRRQSGRPSCLPESLLGRERPEIDLERHHDRDAARRDPGDGPGRLPAAFRGRAARTSRAACGSRRSALRCATWRRREQARRSANERMDKLVVGPQAAHGATLVFER